MEKTLSFSGICARIKSGMETRRKQRHEAMIEDIARGCNVSRGNVVATVNPGTILSSEPFVKRVRRGDVILISGREPMALDVKSIDAQGMTVLAREEGANPVEHKLTPGDSKEVWKGSVPGAFIADFCILSVSLNGTSGLELKAQLIGGMMPF